MNAHAPLDQSTFVPEIEIALLGSLMVGCDAKRVFSIIQPHHFIEGAHRVIFEAVKAAYDRYGSANPAIVMKTVPEGFAEAFGMKNEGLGLSAYLASMCVNATPRPEEGARNVVEQWARHEVLREAEQMQAAASDPAADVREIGKSVARNLDDILSECRTGAKRKTRTTLADAAVASLNATREAMKSGKGLAGATWGLTDINRLTGGIYKRDLTLMAARPSMGKTTTGLSCAIKAAKAGHGIGFISLEMDNEKLAARAISDIAFDWNVLVPYQDLIRGAVEPRQLEAIEAATQDLGKLPLWLEDQSGMTFTDIRVKIEILIEEAKNAGHEIEVVFIDHLGLIVPSSRYKGNRTNEIAEITAGLKSLARELDIAIVALSQLSRAVETRDNKRPQLSDLRDSGAIEQDADTIIFLYREAYYLEREKGGSHDKEADRISRLADCQNALEFIVAKQRNGRIATVDLFASMAHSAVRNGVPR